MLKFDNFFYAKQTLFIFPEFLPVYGPTVLTVFISFQIPSHQASLSSHILTPSLITTMLVQQTQISNKKSLLAHLRRSSLEMLLSYDPVFKGSNPGRSYHSYDSTPHLNKEHKSWLTRLWRSSLVM